MLFYFGFFVFSSFANLLLFQFLFFNVAGPFYSSEPISGSLQTVFFSCD